MNPSAVALSRELARLQRAGRALLTMLEGLRVPLQNILTVDATLVGQRQNEEIQRATESSLRRGV